MRFLFILTAILGLATSAGAQHCGYAYAQYQAYQPTYYQPVYYQPYSYSYAPPKRDTADDLLKELLIRKLALELGVAEKAAVVQKQPALTEEELRRLRTLLQPK